MSGLRRALSDAELLDLGERAIRHAATIFEDFMDCRRRACRRNGCCGPMGGKGGCLTLPDGRRIDGVRVPACMAGIDPAVTSAIAERSRTFLELLLLDPGYHLHSARFQRTLGKGGEAQDARAVPEAFPADGGAHEG